MERAPCGGQAALSVLTRLPAGGARPDDLQADPDLEAAVAMYGPRMARYLREGVFFKSATAEVAGMIL